MTKIIEFLDCALVNIETEDDYDAGCPTCDYGAEYTREIRFSYDNGNFFTLTYCGGDREYGFDIGSVLKILLNNIDEIKKMTSNEFNLWFKDELETLCNIELAAFSHTKNK